MDSYPGSEGSLLAYAAPRPRELGHSFRPYPVARSAVELDAASEIYVSVSRDSIHAADNTGRSGRNTLFLTLLSPTGFPNFHSYGRP